MRNEDVKSTVRRTLKLLVDAVIHEADENPNFMASLERILVRSSKDNVGHLSDRLPLTKRASGPNLLGILYENGQKALQEKLDDMTTEELAQTCVQEGLRKQKEAKALDRAGLVELLFKMTRNRLRQGESFLHRRT